MAVNKYLGPTGLTELINLIQADFQKKQDWMQFPEMPAAADYPGKVVQFTGVTDADFTKGFFYYSTGLEWTMISVASAVEVVDQLPDWSIAKDGIIYYVTSEPACYIRNTSVTGEWFNITDDDSKSFEIVATLPAWDAADPMLIYMVPATDGSTVTGYIKDANTTGKFYQLGGSSVKSFELVATLPSYADASPDILYLVTNGTKFVGYVKDVNTVGQFFELGAAPDPAFEIVDALPQWDDADPSTIYFKADGNVLTGYIKKTGTIGTWCTLGDTIDTALSATSTNPVQNKAIYAAIQDVLAQVSSVYHYKGSCLAADLPVADNKVGDTWNLEDASSYGPQGINVAWDGTKWDALGGDLTPDAVPTDGSQHTVMSGGVYDALLTKEDVNNKVTTIDAASTDKQYPSAKVVYDTLLTKENVANKVTTIDVTSTDDQYPSAKVVYDTLLTKENVANKVTTIDVTSTDDQYPSAKVVYDTLLTKEDVANKVTTIDAASTDKQYPSAKVVYDTLLTKENVNNKVTTIDVTSTDDQYPSAKAVYDTLLTKENVNNKVTTIDVTSTDDQYPSAKAVYDALEGLEPIPEGFVQNVDTGMQPVEDGKVMRISKTAFDALAQRDQNVMYYLDEEHDLIDAKPTCRDVDGNLVKGQKIVELTKEQYNNLAVKDPDTYYMIADDNEAKTWYPRPDWANAVTISADQLYAGYTAPSDGMFVCSGVMPDPISSIPKTITVNDIVIVAGQCNANDQFSYGDCSCPVSEGDLIKSSTSSAWSDEKRYFVPYKAQ